MYPKKKTCTLKCVYMRVYMYLYIIFILYYLCKTLNPDSVKDERPLIGQRHPGRVRWLPG